MPTSRPGELNPRAKLTADDVRAIRRSTDRQITLARRYGVAPNTIWTIRKRLKWTHIDDAADVPASLSDPGEEWRPCWPEYEASNHGRIRRVGKASYLPLPPRKTYTLSGYEWVTIRTPERVRCLRVHALVAVAFLGPRPDGMQINHINGIKTDNRPDNLEYVTPQQNSQHAVALGLRPVGERVWNAKLTAQHVRDIRAAPKRTVASHALATKYGVSYTLIVKIRQGKGWRHEFPSLTDR